MDYKKAEKTGRPPEGMPLTEGAKALWMAHRRAKCDLCPIHRIWTADGEPGPKGLLCMFGNGPVPAAGMIIGDRPSMDDQTARTPWTGRPAEYLNDVLLDNDIDPMAVYLTYAAKCVIPRTENGKIWVADKTWKKDELSIAAVKECGPAYLEKELAAVNPRAVMALGATAYYHFAHKGGITKQRGKAFQYTGANWSGWVVPSVSPDYIFINPSVHIPFESDVAKFGRLMRGESTDPTFEIIDVTTPEMWAAAMEELRSTPDRVMTYDIETRGFDDFKPGYSKVWCAGVTRGVDHGKGPRVFVFPLEHPQSQFLKTTPAQMEWDWEKDWPGRVDELEMVPELGREFVELIRDGRLNGHNVKFDIRHIWSMADRYGVKWD